MLSREKQQNLEVQYLMCPPVMQPLSTDLMRAPWPTGIFLRQLVLGNVYRNVLR